MRKGLRVACFVMLAALALPANAKTGHFVLNFDCTNVPDNQVFTIYNYKMKEAYMGGMTYGLTTTGSMPTYIAHGFEGVQFGGSTYQLNYDGIYFNLPFAGMTNVTLTMKGNYQGGTFWTGYTTDGGKTITKLYYSVDTQNPANDPDYLTPVAGTLTDYTFRTVGFKPVNGNLMFKMNSGAKSFYLRVQKIDVTCDVAEIPDLLYTAVTSTSPIDYAASGLTAYGVTVKDGKAVLTPVTGLVAANSVVLVKGLQAATYPLVTTNSTTDTGTAVTSEVKISDGTVKGDGKTVFALGKDANGSVGFNLVDNGTEVPDGTGYVVVNNATGSFLPLETTPTSISTPTTTAKNRGNATYNLSGQRVESNYRGIVIRGGKKYINR